MTRWHGVVKADVSLSAGELVDLEVDPQTGLVEIKARGERLLEEPATFVPAGGALTSDDFAEFGGLRFPTEEWHQIDAAVTRIVARRSEQFRVWLLSHEASVAVTDALTMRGVFMLRPKVREVLREASAHLLNTVALKRELEYDHDDAPVPWRTRCMYVHADHDGPCEPRDREA